MKHIVFALLILTACVKRPAPVASDTQPIPPAEKLAIAVEYVGVPSMTVYERPALDATVTGSYGLSEAISVIEVKGDWKMIRTFDGTGWVQAKDLLPADGIDKVDLSVPRFYVVPAPVNAPRARGEIELHAKVNTDGAVVEVKTVKNTTGSTALADQNVDSLKKALFYPMVDKGTRKTFIYEHHVYY
ncbi:hypothetical protein L0Y59_04095 [Candidatus Uhrbacteria bacterium]|nr:hypothetical protein [Candidatus Uhrbacteria bacterium]